MKIKNTLKQLNESFISKIKVENLRSSSGREVPNQFIIKTPEGDYFQSYDSIIAFIDKDGNVTLDQKFWNFSNTTTKYRNIFLDEDTKTTKKKIESGEYELDDLNS